MVYHYEPMASNNFLQCSIGSNPRGKICGTQQWCSHLSLLHPCLAQSSLKFTHQSKSCNQCKLRTNW